MTPEAREKAVEAMARAGIPDSLWAGWPNSLRAGRRSEMETALDAAYPIIRDAVEREGWRPIETAPKDGSLILIGGMKHRPPVDVGRWSATTFNRKTKAYNRGWTSSPGVEVRPTHWRPLPAPPADGGGDGV